MLIVCEHITTRLKYVLDYVITVRLGISYRLATDDGAGYVAGEPVIRYSEKRVENDTSLWIPSAGLLDETGVRTGNPEYSESNEMPVLYPVKDGADIPFDLFSAVFWFLTRYEEYNDNTDIHGRFPADASLAVQKGIQDIPVADLWIGRLGRVLKERFPGLKITPPEPFFRLTVDVDQAFAVRHKGFLRNIKGLLQALTCRNGFSVKEYLQILCGDKTDPFDTFNKILPESENGKFSVMFFFHSGRWGEYDKSISINKKAMKDVIAECLKAGDAGLHPSYRVTDRPDLLEKEKQRLEKITGKPVISARFHYIRFRIPHSYRLLLQHGITEDYSMGWPETTGFRAGTAHPFTWYDIAKEEVTPLVIFPFSVMDGVLKDRLGLAPGKAADRLETMIDTMADTGNPFIPLWHNHSLSETGGWEGWSKVYGRMIRKALKRYTP